MFMRFPDVGVTIALGCNRDDVEPVKIAESVAEIILANEVSPKPPLRPIRISKRRARAIRGTYVSDAHVLRVIERGKRLYLVSDRGEFEMIPAASDRFVFRDRPFIVRDAATEVRFRSRRHGGSLVLHTLWDPAEFRKISPIEPSSIRAADYVGRYASEELESEVEVTAKGRTLHIKFPRGEHELEVLTAEMFRAGEQILRFHRSGQRIEAVTISRANLPGITFARTPSRQ